MNTKVDLDRMLELQEQIKELEGKYKPMKEQLVDEMAAQNITSFKHNGKTLSLTVAERWTTDLNLEQMSRLKALGLDYLIKQEYVLNKDVTAVQIQQGKVNRSDIENIIKISETKTFKIK